MSAPSPESYMHHALCLARRGLGATAENPSVGCVIVKDGVIVGRGYTQAGGRPHAETIALLQAGIAAQGAEVYVTLEPCSHQGKTPPCVDQLIAAKVAKVVVALQDPNPQVNGAGLQKLQQAGIETEVGVCVAEAVFLNQGFLMRQVVGRPVVAAKVACTQDGRIALANGASQWITGEVARRRVQIIRTGFDCLLSGIGTVLADNPAFTCRLLGLENRLPLRAIVDSLLRIPPDCRLVNNAHEHPLRLYCLSEAAESDKGAQLRDRGVEVFAMEEQEGMVDLGLVMQHLGKDGVNRVLLEAGETLVTSAIVRRLVDRLFLFRGNQVFGGDARAVLGNLGLEGIRHAPTLHRLAEEIVGEDRLETFLIDYSHD